MPKYTARYCEQKAAYWLQLANQNSERGNKGQAEVQYMKCQIWRDRMNDLLGNGDTLPSKATQVAA